MMTPSFWAKESAKSYVDWVSQKAATHYVRDKKRGVAPENVSVADYRAAIHAAVGRSRGFDYYTNETLRWEQIGRFNNDEAAVAKDDGENYKQRFHSLPTVDHAFSGNNIKFEICSWRTNDAKNDLNLEEFHSLCRNVLEHAGYQVIKPLSAPVAPHVNASTAEASARDEPPAPFGEQA
jgi:hypothetical protein